MKAVSKKQRALLDFIEDYIASHRYPPSFREMAKHLGLSSLASVHGHIERLKKKGVLVSQKKSPRSVFPKKEEENSPIGLKLPLFGTLTEKMRIETYSRLELVDMSPAKKNELYLIRVQGNILNEESILNGDLLVIEPRSSFKEGDLVLAIIGKHTVVVKKVFFDLPYLRFESQSKGVQPLRIRKEEVEIRGIIVSLKRTFT